MPWPLKTLRSQNSFMYNHLYEVHAGTTNDGVSFPSGLVFGPTVVLVKHCAMSTFVPFVAWIYRHGNVGILKSDVLVMLVLGNKVDIKLALVLEGLTGGRKVNGTVPVRSL